MSVSCLKRLCSYVILTEQEVRVTMRFLTKQQWGDFLEYKSYYLQLG